jgi:hypothetical protein
VPDAQSRRYCPPVDHDEIVRLYGPWTVRAPEDVAALLAGYGGLWWIAGGWAMEAFTNVSRPHGDIDPSIPRTDVARFHRHVWPRLDVWQADSGALCPMLEPQQLLPGSCENLWLRRSGADPWEFDVILMHATSTQWTYKRDARISLPIDDLLWTRDGVRYLRPEVQLLHKAPGMRRQDQADFDACAELLSPHARAWLRAALHLAHPGTPGWRGSDRPSRRAEFRSHLRVNFAA